MNENEWRPPNISADFLIWLAGFIDGEGSFSLTREKDLRKGPNYYSYRPVLQISNTHEVVNEIKMMLNCGHVSKVFKTEKHQLCYHFSLANSKQLAWVLGKIIPHLRVKQSQATYLLLYVEHRQSINGMGRYKPHDSFTNKTHEKLRLLNLRGREAIAYKEATYGKQYC